MRLGNKKNDCKLCGGPGTEKHRLYHCKRLQLSEEVSAMEQLAKGDSGCWLWENRGLFPSLELARLRGLSITNRRVEASFAGGRRTLKRGTETPRSYRGRTPLDGSSSE